MSYNDVETREIDAFLSELDTGQVVDLEDVALQDFVKRWQTAFRTVVVRQTLASSQRAR